MTGQQIYDLIAFALLVVAFCFVMWLFFRD